MEREQRHGQRGIVGPLILVGAGMVLLLNNLGLLSWSVWEAIFRLWPLLLIAIGLDIIFSRSALGRPWRVFGALLITLIVLGGVAVATLLNVPQAAASSWGVIPRVNFGGGEVVSHVVDHPLNEAHRAEIDLGLGVGEVNLRAQSEPEGLIDGTVALLEGEQLLQSYRVDGDTAFLSLRQDSMSVFSGESHQGNGRQWDLRLNPEVPTRLKVAGGVSKVGLDLARLRVTDLEVSMGVGKTELTLPRRGQIRATVDGGIGQATVLVPRGVAARIEVNGGLGNISVAGNYQRNGNVYQSQGYDSAQDRVDLVVRGGIGKVRIQEYNVQ